MGTPPFKFICFLKEGLVWFAGQAPLLFAGKNFSWHVAKASHLPSNIVNALENRHIPIFKLSG